MDLISELPKEIKHHILSFLPTKEACKTSVLSKQWKAVWDSRPVVSFNDLHFDRDSDFAAHLEQSLQRFSRQAVSVETLRLTMSRRPLHPVNVMISRWIHFAGTRNLKTLKLSLPIIVGFDLDFASSKTLTKLTLHGVKLSTADHRLEFPSLESLFLDYTTLEDPNLVQELLSASPRLEHLALHGYKAATRLEISHLRLKSLCVKLNWDFHRIAVRAPSLESFVCDAHDRFCDTESRIELEACEATLKELSLTDMYLTGEWLGTQLPRFVRLEVLTLARVDSLTSFEISSPALTELVLRLCENLEDAAVNAPSLIKVDCSGNKFPFYTLLASPLSLRILDFRFWLHEAKYHKTAWFHKLRELFDNLNHINNVVVCITHGAEIAIVYEGLTDSLFRVLCQLYDLFPVKVCITSRSNWESLLTATVNQIFTVTSFDSNMSEYLSSKMPYGKRFRSNCSSKLEYSLVSGEKEVLKDWTEFEGDDETKLALLKAYTGSAPFRLTRFGLRWSP